MSRPSYKSWKFLVLALFLLGGCRHSPERSVTIRVISPLINSDSSVFLAGNIDQLGSWDPRSVALERRADSVWEKTIRVTEGTAVEFKATRGSWRSQEMDPRGIQYGGNHKFRVSGDTLIVLRVAGWQDLNGGTTSLSLSEIIDNHGFWITNGWKYRSGDDSVWRDPAYDDGGWEITNSSMYPDNEPAGGWHGTGWFRLHLNIDSTLWNHPLALHLWQIGASEVYLDGQLLYRFGVVGRSAEEEQAFEDRNPRIITFGAKKEHLLAVRYSNHSPEPFSRVGIYAGFETLVAPPDDAISARVAGVRDVSVRQIVFTTIPLVLAIVHFSLFLFYPKSRENLYYALCMIGFAGITFSNNQMMFTTSAREVLISLSLASASQILAVVSGQWLFYALTFERIKRRGLLAAGIGAALVGWAFVQPNKTMNIAKDIFTILVLLEILLRSFRRGPEKIRGTSIVGAGFLVLAVTVVYELLTGYGVIPTIGNIRGTYVYGALALSVSMSAFLARRFAQTNRQLEVQLQQVRDLSERTLEQERRARETEIERRVLAADNERKTRELDDARQFQLSLLPKEVPNVPDLDLAASSAPATEVGGDYYDFSASPDGSLTVVLGDATGHGARAGTMVAVTKGLFHELAKLPDAGEILTRCNNAVKGMNLGGVYMGMTLARIRGRDLEITAAGMPPALIFRAARCEVEQVILKGMPLGAFSDYPFERRTVPLNPGDALVLMSDGLPERFDPSGQTLDLPAIVAMLQKIGTRSAREILECLVRQGDAWANGSPQNDDMTFVVIKKLG